MRRGASLAALLAAAFLLGACGPTKGLDPLGGYGGVQDTAVFGFESGAQGWAKPTAPGSSTYTVFQAAGQSLYGNASLAVGVLSMTKADAEHLRVSVAFGTPVDLRGKAVSGWVFGPANCQAAADAPDFMNFFAKDAGGRNGYGPSQNVEPGGWKRIVFAPQSNPSGSAVTLSGNDFDAGFDASQVAELGIRVGISDAAPADFRYDGVFLVDSVDWK